MGGGEFYLSAVMPSMYPAAQTFLAKKHKKYTINLKFGWGLELFERTLYNAKMKFIEKNSDVCECPCVHMYVYACTFYKKQLSIYASEP